LSPSLSELSSGDKNFDGLADGSNYIEQLVVLMQVKLCSDNNVRLKVVNNIKRNNYAKNQPIAS
jgi:hypothetical protein